MAVTIYSAQIVGLEARPISVEVDISSGLHIFSIVGLADKEVQEARQRIAAAIKNLGALPPHKKGQRVIVNLAPADIKKEGPAFDLPIALGYLLASGQISFNPEGKIFVGELGLDGRLRRVNGILPIALATRTAGLEELVLPKGNGAESSLIDGLNTIEVETLDEVVDFLEGRLVLNPLSKTVPEENSAANQVVSFKDIHGQEKPKRALIIAAAGGHNAFMTGPPGVGKTILAKAIPTILPPLSFEESLEVTKIHSIAGLLNEERSFIRERPFRNPHHTSSHTSIIGGGANPRPGEITLSHRGVLFLDELPEFDRRVLESLRQPLEEHRITIARAQGTQTFPAQFMMIGAMNPCPCGNLGNQKKDCVCSPGAIHKYKKKISGPLLDRIDIHVETPSLGFDELNTTESTASQDLKKKVENARAVQKERFKNSHINLNSEMGVRELKKFVKTNDRLQPVLRMAHEKYHLSARSYHRLLKLSRTIADLLESSEVTDEHVLEALQYRPKEETA